MGKILSVDRYVMGNEGKQTHYVKPFDFKLRMLLLLNGRRYEGASFGIRTLFIYANFGQKKLRPNLGLNPEITSLL